MKIGTTASWVYTLHNDGDVALAVISIVDDAGTPDDTSDDFMPVYITGDDDNDRLLDQDEIWLFTSESVITHEVVKGDYTNKVEVIARVAGGTTLVLDTDTASLIGVNNKGNNGVGNGLDPQPPGNPPINDGEGTSPGDPGNQGGSGVSEPAISIEKAINAQNPANNQVEFLIGERKCRSVTLSPIYGRVHIAGRGDLCSVEIEANYLAARLHHGRRHSGNYSRSASKVKNALSWLRRNRLQERRRPPAKNRGHHELLINLRWRSGCLNRLPGHM